MGFTKENTTVDTASQDKKKTRIRRNRIDTIVLFFVLLWAIVATVGVGYLYHQKQLEDVAVQNFDLDLESVYTPQEVEKLMEDASTKTKEEFLAQIKDLMLTGDSAVDTLRYFYPNEIVMVDSGEYLFIPISETLKKTTFNNENIIALNDAITNEPTGRLEYQVDGTVVSHLGIDVSKHQGEINWDGVATEGIEYAFIRLGYRGYGSGEIVVDPFFENNIENSARVGIERGVYFFTQAITVEEALEEADFVIQNLAPYQLELPVAIDIEALSDSEARGNLITKEQRTDICIAFLERIREAGYTPLIYGNLKSYILMLDIERLEQYDKWFAAFTDTPYFPYNFDIWQYSESGSVSGINGSVDLNMRLGEWDWEK